jgi:hypothetical protein
VATEVGLLRQSTAGLINSIFTRSLYCRRYMWVGAVQVGSTGRSTWQGPWPASCAATCTAGGACGVQHAAKQRPVQHDTAAARKKHTANKQPNSSLSPRRQTAAVSP